MISVYINYPNKQITIHEKSICNFIQRAQKPNQRKIEININNCEGPLNDFFNKRIEFQSIPELNDIWLEIDFADKEFEIHLVEYIRRILVKHYSPFADSIVKIHC